MSSTGTPVRPRVRSGIGALAIACALVVTPAQAAAPLVIADGGSGAPGVSSDGQGGDLVTWLGNEPGANSLHFCELLRGATACKQATTIPAPADSTSLDRPYAFADGAGVHVLDYRYGGAVPGFSAVYLFSSSDGGAHFDTGALVGTAPFYDAVRGPGNGVSLITNAYQNGTVYQWVPTDGSGQTRTENQLSADHPYNGSVVLAGPNAPFAVFANGAGEAQYRAFTGQGNLNDAAAWTPAQTYATGQSALRLANGPSGMFVASLGDHGIEVRKWGAAGFGAPVAVAADTRPIAADAWDFAEDPGGRLHVAWSRFFDKPAGADSIGYAVSRDGLHWGSRYLAGGPDGPGSLRLAMDADHIGVAVGRTGKAQVLAVRLGPFGPCGLPYVGTAGKDVLIGDPHDADRISGLGGDDTLKGLDNDDCLNGGAGDDTLEGGSGRDSILGGSGGDTIDGGADADTINAGSGHDDVVGGSGSDKINVRDNQVDRVSCGGGNDTVRADRKDRIKKGCESVKFG